MFLSDADKRRRENDAGLVQDYYLKYMERKTQVNKDRYEQLSAWFDEKWKDYWRMYAKVHEIRR